MEYNYNKVTDEIIAKLEEVAPKRVFKGEDINPDFFRDEMPIYGENPPEVVVDCLTTEEVAGVVKVCYDNSIPVIPRGAGTGLVGASVAIHNGVMINLQKMNKILDYDLDNMIVRVQPGVLLKELADDALQKGYLYPPDPGEKFATLGGNVSTNAGGMRAVKYGTTRDYVRAMVVVLPTGEIEKFGANVSKSTTGYSLLNLMIGSEGTLGIITELTLKIIPAPKENISLIIPFEDIDTCISTVPMFFKKHYDPQAIEFMEREIVISSEKFVGKEVFPKEVEGTEVGAYLLVTFDGDDMDSLMDKASDVAEAVLEEGAIDVLIADTPAKKQDAWAARSSFLEAIESQTELLDECDVVVPMNMIAKYLNFVKGIAEKYDFEVKSFGHAGDGNLHIYTCSNDMEKDEFKKQVKDFMDEVYDEAKRLGGQISGEHGIGHGKQKYLERITGNVQMELMRGIKKVFDPKNILNPGKVVDSYNE